MIYIELPIWVAILLTLIIVAPTLVISIVALIKQLTENRMSRIIAKLTDKGKISGFIEKKGEKDQCD